MTRLFYLPFVLSVLYAQPMLASVVTVPDHISTIQGALDTGADSILIRGGIYPESPTVYQQIYIGALNTDSIPTLQGLNINPLYTGPGVYTFTNLHMQSTVVLHNFFQRADVAFVGCYLAAGLRDEHDFIETRTLAIRRCQLSGRIEALARESVVVDSCQFTYGTLDASNLDCPLSVSNSRFEGPGSSYGVIATNTYAPVIINNYFRNYGTGCYTTAHGATTITQNEIVDCAIGIEDASARSKLSNNVVRRCEFGIVIYTVDDNRVSANMIDSCNVGLYVNISAAAVVDSNVITDCVEAGIRVTGRGFIEARIVNNTVAFNSGTGIVSSVTVDQFGPFYEIGANNICYNGGYGIDFRNGMVTSSQCNNLFGNTLGNVTGRPSSPQDTALEPGFCDTTLRLLRLRDDSPLTTSTCEPVGALGVGCEDTVTTDVLVERFVVTSQGDGVVLAWILGFTLDTDVIWIERGPSVSGPWVRPETIELVSEPPSFSRIDATADPGKNHWYRLVMKRGLAKNVIAGPLEGGVRESGSPNSIAISPNPASGEIVVRFTLRKAAFVTVTIMDIQGRTIATIARGAHDAGGHGVSWSGRRDREGVAGSGIYFVRYRYPGGEQVRRISLMR